MKKNITINLCGQLYAIDEDACSLLEQYLDNMKRYFSQREGGDEIADDIEHRVAEIFAELKEQGVEAISIEAVENIIHRIGNPEELEDEDYEPSETDSKQTTDNAQAANSASANGATPPPPPHKSAFSSFFATRKLYRDPDDMMLGGVIAGICKYFGGTDPLPWRILMVLLAFASLSTMGIIYLIAWALIPLASTAEERLLMQGKPINPQSLNEELMRCASKANDYLHSPNVQSKASGCMGTLLYILVFLLKLAGLVAVALFLLSGVFMTIMLGILTFGSATILVTNNMVETEFVEMLNTAHYLSWELWGIAIAGFTCLGIVFYSLIRSLIKRPTDKCLSAGTRTTLIIIGLLSAVTFITLCTVVGLQVKQLEYNSNHKNGYYLQQYDRERLARNNWQIIAFDNCNDSGQLYFKENFADKGRISYFLFEKGGKSSEMRAQIERTQYLKPGRYRLEAMGWSSCPGAYIYARSSKKVVACEELPATDGNFEGNLQKMSHKELARTAFFEDSLTVEQYDTMKQLGFGSWSYVQSATFDHPGGSIEYGITNLPEVVGLEGGREGAWKFALHQLRIEPVDTSEKIQ